MGNGCSSESLRPMRLVAVAMSSPIVLGTEYVFQASSITRDRSCSSGSTFTDLPRPVSPNRMPPKVAASPSSCAASAAEVSFPAMCMPPRGAESPSAALKARGGRASARRGRGRGGPLAQHLFGVLSPRRSSGLRKLPGRHQRRVRARESAHEGLREQRMLEQLGRREHGLAAAVRDAQERVPLVAGAFCEERIHFGGERKVQPATLPLLVLDRLAEPLPELRLQ